MAGLNSTLAERTQGALRGRFEVEREIGRGGMATVFLARDPRHDRPVAVKVLHPDLAAAIGTDRFLREVRITARLSHPHILPLLDSGEGEGLLYYVMPFVEGESLRARLDRQGALPVQEALTIAREVADALGFAHGRGIVHRDIKPENILLDSGHALVADFGIARAFDEASVADRVTVTGIAVGTPLYMSPEQAEGRREVDARSDIYSLGRVLYEMLAGAPPFTGPTAHAILARRLSAPAPSVRLTRDSVPESLDATVQRALARSPGDRFQTTAELAQALALVAPGSDRAATPPAITTHPLVRAPSWGAAAIAITALVLALGIWAILGRDADQANGPGGSETASIAVLPFVNLSADAEHQYFADGLTDELITTLSRVKGFQVPSRTSSFAFKQADLDVREIGRRLDVRSVLEGTIRRGEGRVRVSVRLVSVSDGFQQWSNTYEEDAQDALQIQESIARAIVETLQGQLGSAAHAVTRGGTTDPEAYDLFLRALFFRQQSTEQGMLESVKHYRAALERAPDFARAHAALAEAYCIIGYYGFRPPSEVFTAAALAAREALRFDPELAAAHNALEYVALYYDWDWALADREFRRSIALDPNYGLVRQWYGNFLTAMGRFDKAEEEMRRSQALDAFRTMPRAVIGWVWFYKGDFERAVALLDSVIAVSPGSAVMHRWRAQALEMLGRYRDALAAYQRSVELSGEGGEFLAGLARGHALLGERAEAERLLARLAGERAVPTFEIAKVHLALGDRAGALSWLERAFEARSHSMVFLGVDPQLAPLRGDPRFEQLVTRMAFPTQVSGR